jgi:hypothetical protein
MEHFMSKALLQSVNAWFPWVFWSGMALIIGVGFWIAVQHKKKSVSQPESKSTDNPGE